MECIISRPNKVVLVPNNDQVQTLWPGVKTLGHNGHTYALIPHTPNDTIKLRDLGINVPAPILEYYDWCGGTPFHTQTITAELLTSNHRAYVLSDMGCVDADTEYLGEDGWYRIADYKQGKVAQYDPKTRAISFVEPTKYVKLPCPEMIRFKTSRGVDQLLSPEHRVLLADGSVVSAADIERDYGKPETRKRFKFRTTFRVDGTEGIDLTDEEIRVQIAINADGYIPRDAPTGKVYIRIKKERKKTRLRRLLAAAEIVYTEREVAPEGFTTFSFQPPWPKGFDHDWWLSTQRQLDIVADEAVHWDGSQRKAGGRGFYSNSQADVDFVQYAYSASGCRASLRSSYRVRGDDMMVEHRVYAKSGNPDVGLYGLNDGVIAKNVWREPSPDGFKYCFMVPTTFLLLRRNGCIFATGNTGKTKAALWSWHYLYKLGCVGRLLVVAPLSTLYFVWLSEVTKTLPGIKAVVVHHSDRKRRLALLKQEADVYIINHDGLKTIAPEVYARKDIDCLVLDELAVYRNKSIRSKQMREFAPRFKYAWGMSGRPMPQAPTDVWSQCKILTPHTVPTYFTHAQSALMVKINDFKWLPKKDAVETAFSWMQPAVRFALDDVVELPEAIYWMIDVDMSEQQGDIYKQLTAKMAVYIKDKVVTAANAGVCMNKLLQIAAGYVYTDNPQAVVLDSKPRQDMLLELIDEAPHKVIVFAPWTHLINGLSQLLTKSEVDHALVHGQTSHREVIFNDFQNTSRYKVLLAHPQTVHHGLTLTSATTIIWHSPPMSLEVYEQANARIRRVGQKHKQQFLHLKATTVERKVYAMLQGKQKIQDEFLDMIKTATDASL